MSTAECGLSGLARRLIRPRKAPIIDLPFVLLAAAVYGALFLGIGNAFLPGHAAWCTLLLWAVGQLGGKIAYYCYLPSVTGQLVAGMLLRNLPWSAVDAFPAEWGAQMRAAALATIFLRCGLELNFDTLRTYKAPAARLAFIPGLCEAFYDAGLATVLFDMPFLLGCTLGFIMKSVGPGLAVPKMFELQREGWGMEKGIPNVVVVSASFDDAIAFSGYAIFSTLAIHDSTSDEAWDIAKGPLQVVFGIVGGMLLGLALGCTKIFRTRLHRWVGTFTACLLIMFFLNHYGMLAGGSLGALTTGLVAQQLWALGLPRLLSQGPDRQVARSFQEWLGLFWAWVAEPILFTTIGSAIDFSTLEDSTIPKSILIICTGLALRMLVTFFTMAGLGYTWHERLFFSVAWTPKATIQAALSAQPLALIKTAKVGAPNYTEWLNWGQEILTTGIFTIVVCGPLGVTLTHYLAPKLLKQSARPPASLAEEEGSEGKLKGSESATGELPGCPAALKEEHDRLARLYAAAQGAGLSQKDTQHIEDRMAALHAAMC